MKLEAKEDKIKPKGLWRANPKFSHLATENPPILQPLSSFKGPKGGRQGPNGRERPPHLSLCTPPHMLNQPDVNSKEKGKFRDWGGTRVSHTTHTPLVTLLQASIQPTSAPRTYLALNREDHFNSVGAPPPFALTRRSVYINQRSNA